MEAQSPLEKFLFVILLLVCLTQIAFVEKTGNCNRIMVVFNLVIATVPLATLILLVEQILVRIRLYHSILTFYKP